MARGYSGMLPANPYPRAKENVARLTLCELCDRQLPTKDWPAHKNSKKHRAAEAEERAELEKTKNDNSAWDGANSGDAFDKSATSGNDGWGSGGDGWGSGGGFSTATTNYTNNNNRGGGDERACFGCGLTGHQKRDCPKGSGGGQVCYNCGAPGHRKADCTEPRKPMTGGGGGSDRLCFNCNLPGHNKADCPEPPAPRAGGGGGRTCHNCDSIEHLSRDCDQPRVWSRVKCRNCENFGHGAARCPEPPREDTGGGWGDTGGAWTAAAGAQNDAVVENTGEAAVDFTGDWADESNAAADAAANGDNWGNADSPAAW